MNPVSSVELILFSTFNLQAHDIQGVSGGIVNILGDGSTDYSE
jgi:hypothetical protein